MDIFILLLMSLFVYFIPKTNVDYLSNKSTKSLKGLLALFIICFIFIYNYIIGLIDITLTKQSGNTFILGSYFIIFSTIITNYIILGKINLLFFPITLFGYYIGYISYKQYKKTRT